MKIKYNPCNTNRDSIIKYINENTIAIDGKHYEFDTESVEFPQLAEQTSYDILNAYREESGELFLTIRRYYQGTYPKWGDGEYHEING